ncbi:ArsR/SmtB family transcription factor [Haloarchaeobius salinus]|uniref:ArsR/SmtB family transcription factor n=1 Tax=Haloarchaeobius salinus TaxID=1198298 RepID=UPI00210E27EF|nr:winged helix-turn-helix domain-containing protein [Haloarchaeobius salinus]
MSEEVLVDVAGLLEDEYARAILVNTSSEPMSATELAERCDASPPTIYRRIDRLREHDLVESEQELDPDGHHYEVFVANLERVTIELGDDGFEVEIERQTDPADRFTSLFEELR